MHPWYLNGHGGLSIALDILLVVYLIPIGWIWVVACINRHIDWGAAVEILFWPIFLVCVVPLALLQKRREKIAEERRRRLANLVRSPPQEVQPEQIPQEQQGQQDEQQLGQLWLSLPINTLQTSFAAGKNTGQFLDNLKFKLREFVPVGNKKYVEKLVEKLLKL
jgi:hypothetical protein